MDTVDREQGEVVVCVNTMDLQGTHKEGDIRGHAKHTYINTKHKSKT